MKKILKKIFYFVIGLVPKNRSKIVLESHPDFCDSAKALYDYLNSYGKREYYYVWLVDNPDYYNKKHLKNTKFIDANKPVSLRYIYHVITSKYLMFGNREIRWVDLKKQVVLNLTHGLPFKKSRGLLPADHTFNYLLSSSDAISPYLADEFISSVGKSVIAGLPRNDVMFKKDKNVEKIINGYDKFILWLPTYKKHKSADIVNSLKYSNNAIPLFNFKELNKLNDYLKEKKVLVILKFHPVQDLTSFKGKNFSNIKFWKNEDMEKYCIQLYPLLGYADALITDYSSVGVDFLLMDRPLAYVQDDIKEFTDSRGFCFENIDEMTPGSKIKTVDDFYEFIEEVLTGKDKYKKDRKRVRDFYHKYQDGTSCKVVSDYFDL